MKAGKSKAIVVDASVARAAGKADSVDDRSRCCRAFLEAMLTICHRVVMTSEIRAEWNKHASRFASQWLVSMTARKKVVRPNFEMIALPESDLSSAGFTAKEIAAMSKDALLPAAASEADRTVASLDDVVRALFAKAVSVVSGIGDIVWVNPGTECGQMAQWLENGAKPDTNRRLRNWKPKSE